MTDTWQDSVRRAAEWMAVAGAEAADAGVPRDEFVAAAFAIIADAGRDWRDAHDKLDDF